jgi:hypothetical protein
VLSDRPDPVPEAVWAEAARHHDEGALAGLVLAIATINVWNRLNVTTKQVASPELAKYGREAGVGGARGRSPVTRNNIGADE